MSRFEWLEITPPNDMDMDISTDTTEKLRDDRYYLDAGQQAHMQGKFDLALRYYSRALSINPRLEIAWRWQVVALIDLMEFQEAAMWADKAMEIFPQHPHLLAAKAMAVVRMGRGEEAMTLSDAGLRGSREWWVWLARGDVLLMLAQPAALYCLHKAIEYGQRDPWVLLRVGMSALTAERPGMALEYLKKVRDRDPHNAFVWYLMGRCYERDGEWGLAHRAYTQARMLDPRDARIQEALIRMRRLGRLRRVWRWFRGKFLNV